MQRILIVSNRLPITIRKHKEEFKIQQSVGGLATGLNSFHKSYDSIWIGWSGITGDLRRADKENIKAKLSLDFHCYPIFLNKKEVDDFYGGFCNKTIWPLFHGFTQYTRFEENYIEAYRYVNEEFCQFISKIINENDTIWIHDYHLMLLPSLLREKFPNLTIGFFLHITFPSLEIFRLLPWRNEILEGLLGSDLIGFHTYEYVHNFFSCVRRLLGYEQSFDQIFNGKRIIKVDAFPMGIDYKRFKEAALNMDVQKEIRKNRERVGNYKIILTVDRLDYTKGIIERLEAYDYFLRKYPEYKEKVRLIMVAVPSRTGVEQYGELKEQVDELIGNINGKYGSIGWVPIWYLYRSLSFNKLVALYSMADICLVTPLRDGMNLVAKEYLATKTDGRGVLILSEMAGAATELGEALIVNPNNTEEIVRSLKTALEMSEEDQIDRNKIMRNRLERYNVNKWAQDFIDGISDIKERQGQIYSSIMNNDEKNKLIEAYFFSKKRLILLDYDGTLVPFAPIPSESKPDDNVIRLLEDLSQSEKTEVVIISGRDKNTLDEWFTNLHIGLAAEHGAWIKINEGRWDTIEPMNNDWKSEIIPVLEYYVDRTPGSFVEEKDFSLVWHFRKADHELSAVRSKEVKETLHQLTGNLNLGVLEGNMAIEVKQTGVNKGQAALKWVERDNWDFILAVGDDITDEDTFNVLPDSAFTIKVGIGYSKAKYNLESTSDARSLLEKLKG